MTSDPTERGDIDQAWAAGMSRRSVVSRWIAAAVAVAVGVGSFFIGQWQTVAIGVLVLVMSAVWPAIIHHRAVSACMGEGIRTSVTAIPDEHLTRVRPSLAAAIVTQLAAWVFVGGATIFLVSGINGEILVIGASRELPPSVSTAFGLVTGGCTVALALYEILLLATSPDHRTWSMRLGADGIEIIRGWHILHIPWTDLISADPIPEPKTSLLPACSIRLHHRTASGTLATKKYTIRGLWIPTNPKLFLQALRDYHQHPDLRAELGHPASVNRITRHT